MGTKKNDTFANFAAVRVAESAANTFTATKFAFPFSIMDKMALIISRIEYWLQTPDSPNSTADTISMGISASAVLADTSNQADPLIIDNMYMMRVDYGTAANGTIYQAPYIKDFSNLVGGGLLVAPSPLYAWIVGSGTSKVNSAWFKLFYTYIELATDEYWQLVESRRIISS